MDNLFRQTKLQFSGNDPGKKEEPGSSKDRKIPLQKTQSFKDKKKEPNWFRKQVTWKMSQDYDSSGVDEQVMAVAAAAYAITSLEESKISDHKRAKEYSKASTVSIKSKKEDPAISIPDHGRVSKTFSEITQISDSSDSKKPEKVLHHTPSFKKTSSSLDKQLSGNSRELSGSFKENGTFRPDLPTSTLKPVRSLSSGNKQPSESFKRSSTSKPDALTGLKPVSQLGAKTKSPTSTGMGKSQADIWEETELARITERYETQKSTILTWEGKKKTKAKRRLDNTERELERLKANALAKYNRDIKSIDQVVGGAKAKANEKKKNDELKVKEKANTLRKTGRLPKTCSCF